MRKLLLAASAALALAGGSAATAAPDTPEQKLAKALDGRVAGEPVRCIDYSRVDSATIIPEVGILYRAGRTVYLNRPEGSDRLDSWDILVTKLFGSRLCQREIVHLKDPSSRMTSGWVSLGSFTPYTRPER